MAEITRRLRGASLALACALACSLLSSAPRARAQLPQEGFALDQFHPAPAGDRFFGIQNAEAEGHLRLRGQLLLSYARDPLVIYQQAPDGDEERVGAIVSDRLVLHVGAALPLFNRACVSVDMPVALINTGDALDVAGQSLTAPEGFSLGDLRAGVRLRLAGIGPIQIALAGYLWLPTGEEEDFTGAGGVRASPQLVVSGSSGAVVYAVQAGALFAPEAHYLETTIGHQLVFGGALGYLAARERLQIGPELYGSAGLSGDDAFSSSTTTVELLLGARYRVGSVVVGGGVGPGFGGGAGSPAVRAVASVTFAPISQDRDYDGISDDDDACPTTPGFVGSETNRHGCPAEVADRDKDGVADPKDACPDEPGPHTELRDNDGCPDRDGDGLPDGRDACPTVRGSPSADATKNGCPPDADGDGILDDVDACPDVAGVASPRRRRNGCPPDRDGDGIPDAEDACPAVRGAPASAANKAGCPPDTDSDGVADDKDACPAEAGTPDRDRKKSGCPTVFLTATAVELREPIRFEPGTDVLAPESEPVLVAIAKLLGDHPELRKVQIEAHTDEPGGKVASQNMSNRRAASVKKWLVGKGKVEAKRLDTRGFGSERKLVQGDTEEAREKNRRIELTIQGSASGDPGSGSANQDPKQVPNDP